MIRGWLGIEAQALSRELAASFGLQTPQGVIVAGVVSGGPAEQAGLEPGDVLLAVDGEPILDARSTMSEIASIPPGTSLPLTIVRSGERMEMTLEVGERPLNEEAPGQRDS